MLLLRGSQLVPKVAVGNGLFGGGRGRSRLVSGGLLRSSPGGTTIVVASGRWDRGSGGSGREIEVVHETAAGGGNTAEHTGLSHAGL